MLNDTSVFPVTLLENAPRHQHCNVSDAGAEIQDTLTWTNSCFTEQSFGERSKT
jgi:hypothetical protein